MMVWESVREKIQIKFEVDLVEGIINTGIQKLMLI